MVYSVTHTILQNTTIGRINKTFSLAVYNLLKLLQQTQQLQSNVSILKLNLAKSPNMLHVVLRNHPSLFIATERLTCQKQ